MKKRHRAIPLLFLLLAGAAVAGVAAAQSDPTHLAAGGGHAKALFGGGCFWCMEAPFDELPGVISTTSGYAGGAKANPTYREVSAGRTGHTEVVQVIYDPDQVSYERLLKVFWRNIDPTVRNRQFCDRGTQYRSAIYAYGDEQLRLAEASKQELLDAGRFRQIVTEIEMAGPFYPAEEYHQDYYKKNPVRYKTYRLGCGRDARLRELWGEEAGP